jgi:hypothetical protein
MNKLIFRISAVAGAFAICSSASAQFINGNKLHEMCITDKASALNYSMGVADAHTFHRKKDPLFCLPESATAGQVLDVLCKYLADRPEKRHFTASSTSLLAFSAAFPCS